MRKYNLTVLICVVFSSCGIYRQNAVNVPLMQQKGQAQVSGHVSFNGLTGQAACALTNNIAILANYTDMGERKRDNYIDKHTFKEFGAGLYKKNTTGKIREVFLIAGNGATSHTAMKKDSTGILRSQKVSYSSFIIQADFGNKKNKVEYAFSPRLLSVDYYHIVDNTRSDYKDLSNFHIYAEGVITLQYHLLKYLKISGQACTTLPIIRSGVGTNYYYDFAPFNYSIGLIFNIDLVK